MAKLNLLPTQASRVAHNAREGWVQALLSEFVRLEKNLYEELLTSSEGRAADVARGRIMQVRDMEKLVTQIGEKYGN